MLDKPLRIPKSAISYSAFNERDNETANKEVNDLPALQQLLIFVVHQSESVLVNRLWLRTGPPGPRNWKRKKALPK